MGGSPSANPFPTEFGHDAVAATVNRGRPEGQLVT
jgi:hypothetical protein